MTPGRLLEIAEQHPPELDITDLDALAALLDKATPGHHPLSTAESAAHHMANAKDEIVRALPALLAYVRELEAERDALRAVVRAADYMRTREEHSGSSPGCVSCAAIAAYDAARAKVKGTI